MGVYCGTYADSASKLWASCHRLVKTTYNLPIQTHKYLIDDLCILKKMIKRFLKCNQVIESSSKPHIRLLHKYQSTDNRSSYGRNIRNICRDSGSSDISTVEFTNIRANPVPVGEEWRITVLKDLISDRHAYDSFFTKGQAEILINIVCC